MQHNIKCKRCEEQIDRKRDSWLFAHCLPKHRQSLSRCFMGSSPRYNFDIFCTYDQYLGIKQHHRRFEISFPVKKNEQPIDVTVSCSHTIAVLAEVIGSTKNNGILVHSVLKLRMSQSSPKCG